MTIRSASSYENTTGRKQILIAITSKSFRLLHKDCDLCQAKEVWCNAFTCGDANTKIFVCSKCQKYRMRINEKVLL